MTPTIAGTAKEGIVYKSAMMTPRFEFGEYFQAIRAGNTIHPTIQLPTIQSSVFQRLRLAEIAHTNAQRYTRDGMTLLGMKASIMPDRAAQSRSFGHYLVSAVP